MGTHRRIGVALGGAVLLGVSLFLGWHVGVPAYARSQPVPPVSAGEVLALPAQVYDPSPYVGSTQDWGPPGPVSVVMGGREAQAGFTGTVSDPWYVVSARTGEYTRLSAPHLEQAAGQPWVSPDGTRIAWQWPGGIEVYDTISGETRHYAGPAGAAGAAGAAAAGDAGARLTWAPDSTRIAYGQAPVRVLDTGTGEVVDLDLRATDATTPAWTADGQWLTVPVDGALESVQVASGERRRVPTGVGELRSAAWNRADALAGLLRVPTGESLRVLRTTAPDGQSTVARTGRPALVISDLWGWLGDDEVVLTGLDPDSGALELAMAFSVRDRSLRPIMRVPAPEGNFAGISTMSVAADVLQQPTRDYPKVRDPWSAAAKLTLCMLVAVFPMLYFLVARRPRR